MTPVMVAMAGALVLAGVVMVVFGSLRIPRLSTGRSTPVSKITRVRVSSRSAWVRVVVAVIAGVVGLALTGWPLMLVIGPAAVLGLPVLLGSPPTPEVDMLQALDRWIRSMTATLPTGASVSDALRISGRAAPRALADPIGTLVLRLDDRWTTDEALQAFADDLDSPDADAVAAALMLAARRGGTGATDTLTALSTSLQNQLRAAREVEAERAKPRIVVRQVTVITVVVLVGALLVGREFFAPYGTVTGQVILALLVSLYVGALVMLRRMTIPARRERILVRRADR